MKKLVILLLALISLMACSSETRQLDEEKYNAYLTTYQSILDNEDAKEFSPNYDIKLVRIELDNTYRYDLIIDNPKVAMYNVKVLMIIDNTTSSIDMDKMMPSVGILENNEYNLIPFQVDIDKGYYRGLNLSVLHNEPSIRVSVMVSFSNDNKTQIIREFLTLSYIKQDEPLETE